MKADGSIRYQPAGVEQPEYMPKCGNLEQNH